MIPFISIWFIMFLNNNFVVEISKRPPLIGKYTAYISVTVLDNDIIHGVIA